MVLAQLPLPVAIVDLETTGGHFEEDRITEIAILRFDRGQITRHQWLVNPQKPISDFVIGLTGIDNEMVRHAPLFADIAPQLLPLLRGHLLVAHNSRFDYTFLRRAFGRAGMAFAAPTLDTVPFSRKLYPQHIKHNLDSIISRFNLTIQPSERHRAIGDVWALTQFLALSLAEKTAEPWLRQWHALIKPGYLPTTLSPALRTQLYALPDTAGISVWQSATADQPQLWIHTAAFSEITTQLQKKTMPHYGRKATAVRFIPAISSLHAYFLYGQYLLQHSASALPEPPQNTAGDKEGWYTIQFTANHRGQLQPHIKRLTTGLIGQRPYGLFAHPKAARRALADWAQQYQLCPAVLDITPKSLGKSEPCPKQAIQLCDGHCRTEAAIQLHNQQLLKHAPLLPVCDWGRRHELELIETDALNGQRIHLNIQAGCMQLDQQHWFFHPALPRLIKQRLKQPDSIIVHA